MFICVKDIAVIFQLMHDQPEVVVPRNTQIKNYLGVGAGTRSIHQGVIAQNTYDSVRASLT